MTNDTPTTTISEAIYVALVGRPLDRVQMADKMKEVQRGERKIVNERGR